MMDDRGNTVLAGLLAFVVVMAFIGWAKFVDKKKDVAVWQDYYFDAMDELREVKENRDDIEFMRQACIVDRNFYKNALDAVPAYCSAGLYEVTIDGLEARVNYLEGQLESCTNAYVREFWNKTTVCGWDMCLCNEGEFEGCPIYVLEYYTDQAVCRTDQNCKSCMWQMVDNGGGLEHAEILWCLKHAYRP